MAPHIHSRARRGAAIPTFTAHVACCALFQMTNTVLELDPVGPTLVEAAFLLTLANVSRKPSAGRTATLKTERPAAREVPEVRVENPACCGEKEDVASCETEDTSVEPVSSESESSALYLDSVISRRRIVDIAPWPRALRLGE